MGRLIQTGASSVQVPAIQEKRPAVKKTASSSKAKPRSTSTRTKGK